MYCFGFESPSPVECFLAGLGALYMDSTCSLAVAILAAGKGTRMRSDQPKVLHRLGSFSLVERVIQTVLALEPDRCLVVVGYAQDQIRQALGSYPIEFVEQSQQLGTGHAAQQLIPSLQAFQGNLLILNADAPLLQEETLRSLLNAHHQHQSSVTLLSAIVSDPTGYGRVFCDGSNQVQQIVEHRDCTPEQRQNPRINSGVYCFRWSDLVQALPQLKAENQQKEYYLTDVISLLPSASAVDVADPREIAGINDRVQLSHAYTILQDRIKTHWMKAGVTLIDPDSITIEDQVQLAPDTIIEPQTHLRGETIIGPGCRIGPGTLIENGRIGANCQILFSVVRDSEIGDQTMLGPYAHVRGQSQIADQCRIGNFVEIKNTSVQAKTNAAHLAYLGDAKVGTQVNIGAGTIIANYDGIQKHLTQIGDRSKTGANSVLIAPLTVGQDVTIAAGSTITHDLPDDCLAIARARQVVKPGWQLKPKDRSSSTPNPTSASNLSSDPPVSQTAPATSGSSVTWNDLKIHALRLNPDQDLKQAIVQYTLDQTIKAGFIMTAVGSLKQAALRFADQSKIEIRVGRFEILSLTGTLCLDGVHLHLALADQLGQTLGGHLQPGCLIYTTAEIIIGESPTHHFSRELDPMTGFQELQIKAHPLPDRTHSLNT